MKTTYKVSEKTSQFMHCLEDLASFHNRFTALLEENKATEDQQNAFFDAWSDLNDTCLALTMSQIKGQVENYFKYTDARPEL